MKLLGQLYSNEVGKLKVRHKNLGLLSHRLRHYHHVAQLVSLAIAVNNALILAKWLRLQLLLLLLLLLFSFESIALEPANFVQKLMLPKRLVLKWH